jgi:hypothetical protein
MSNEQKPSDPLAFLDAEHPELKAWLVAEVSSIREALVLQVGEHLKASASRDVARDTDHSVLQNQLQSLEQRVANWFEQKHPALMAKVDELALEHPRLLAMVNSANVQAEHAIVATLTKFESWVTEQLANRSSSSSAAVSHATGRLLDDKAAFVTELRVTQLPPDARALSAARRAARAVVPAPEPTLEDELDRELAR